jgi:hypothetical protein
MKYKFYVEYGSIDSFIEEIKETDYLKRNTNIPGMMAIEATVDEDLLVLLKLKFKLYYHHSPAEFGEVQKTIKLIISDRFK